MDGLKMMLQKAEVIRASITEYTVPEDLEKNRELAQQEAERLCGTLRLMVIRLDSEIKNPKIKN